MSVKKMIAPIIVTLVMLLYYVAYFVFLVAVLDGIWKYALGIIPLAFAAVTVGVCIERMKEIKEGEEDDLGQY